MGSRLFLLCRRLRKGSRFLRGARVYRRAAAAAFARSEEHTSELQSRLHLVCRLLLEKKKNTNTSLLLITLKSIHEHNKHIQNITILTVIDSAATYSVVGQTSTLPCAETPTVTRSDTC